MSHSRQPNAKLSSSTALSRVAGKLSMMAMLIATGAMMTPATAFAIDAGELPTNGTVVGGDASFDYSQPNKLDIHQNTDRTVINWESFNIGKDATTQFYQPNSNSLAVNRVYSKGVDPTQILGKLIANGKVMVLDRNGVIFGGGGKSAVVDVGGIIASTGDINVNQVMSGANRIDITNISDAAVINNGLITVKEAGLVGIVGKSAINNGVINAKVGRVALASGEKATVDLYGDQLIEIAVDSNLETALASNTGTITAEGGTVQITASAAKNAVDSVVNTSGIIEVSSVEVKGGKIILGGGNSTVKVSGKVKADGATGGGKIDIKGKDVTVAEGTEISANAVTSGNGGKVDLIADNIMDFSGLITARGGALSGNGGEVEVSGYEGLNYAGLADLTASKGEMGKLLLDPRFMVIYGSVIPASSTYSISAARLAQQIRTADVTIQADQYIDVGTKNGVYSENVGSFFTNLATNAALNLLPDGNVDLSTFLVTQSSFPFFATGTTTGNLTLKSATVNFNKDVILGNGNLTVDASTVNLGSKVYESNGTTLLGDRRLIGTSAVNTVNVSSNGKINQGIWFADDTAALTTVYVAAGNYAESVNVNKANVALRGNGVLNGSRITPNSPGVRISADNVTVDGLTIVGASGASDGYGIIVDGYDNATISNNFVIGSQLDGIKVKNSDSTEVTGNTVNGAGRNGILVETSADADVNKNIVSNISNPASNVGNGIYILSSNGASVTDNTVSNTSWNGIRLSSASNALVQGNDIITAGTEGIYSQFGGNVNIDDNTVNGAGIHGIMLMNTGSNNRVTNNKINDISKDGIRAQVSNGVVITGNTIGAMAGLGQDGIRLDGTSNALVDTNTINNTARHGIYASLGRASVTGNTISNNTINTTGNTAIYLNRSNGSFVTVNKIGLAGLSDNIKGDGIRVEASNGATVTGNIIKETFETAVDIGSGIYFLNSNNATVNDNIISNAVWDGIKLNNSDGISVINNNISNIDRIGIYANDSAGTTISDNTILSTDAGIRILDASGITFIDGNKINNTTSDGIVVLGADDLTIQGNFIGLGPDLTAGTADDTVIGGNGITAANSILTSIIDNLVANAVNSGINISAGANTAVVANNQVTNSDTGMTFESGLIDLTGLSNTVTGGRIGYHFEPLAGNSVNLVGNTIGSSIFAGQSQYYVELANGALFNPGTPTIISAIDSSFDGFVPNTVDGLNLTQAQFDQLENGIYHFNDDNTLGLFFFGFSPLIDQSDLFREIAGIPGVAGRFSITIRGLPRIEGITVPAIANTAGATGFSLNDITPAAGGDATDGTNNASGNSLDQIVPEAGGSANVVEANNWNSAIDAASQGQVVNYSFAGDNSDIMRTGF